MSRRPRYQAWDQEEALDEVKLKLCYSLRKIALRERWNQKAMARHLFTTEAIVSRICRLRTQDLTLNQLFRLLATVEPGFEILIAF